MQSVLIFYKSIKLAGFLIIVVFILTTFESILKTDCRKKCLLLFL